MSYYEAVGKSGGPYDANDMAMFGRTGQKPENSWAFKAAMLDPILKAAYNTAKLASLKVVQAEAQTAVNVAKAEAIQSGQIAASAVGPGTPMKTYLLIGGGLAVLAAVLVLKKKKKTVAS